MKIVSWNINGVKARRDRLLNWLERHQPDVLCVQEIKTEGEHFPFEEVGNLGYYAEICGQKAYHGVALLAKKPLKDVQIGLPDGTEDPQARLVAATVGDVRVVCVYVPNGGELTSVKWPYKLDWYRRLRTWLDATCDPTQAVAICGDFNVAPLDLDIQKPEAWTAGVLANDEARAALQHMVDWGFVDTFRQHHPDTAAYSWWDYRRRGMAGGDGLRIDMVYASQSLAARCTAVGIDREERKEQAGWTKPSDHAPVWAEFSE